MAISELWKGINNSEHHGSSEIIIYDEDEDGFKQFSDDAASVPSAEFGTQDEEFSDPDDPLLIVDQNIKVVDDYSKS